MTTTQQFARIYLDLISKEKDYEILMEKSRDNVHTYAYYGAIRMAMVEMRKSIYNALQE